MEVRDALTVSTFEDDAIKIKKQVQSLSFWRGVLCALYFFGIQLLTFIPLIIIGFAIYGTERGTEVDNLVLGVGIPVSFIIGAYVLHRKRGLVNNTFQYNFSFFKLTPLGLLLLLGISHIVSELMTFIPNYEEFLASYKAMFEGQNFYLLLLGGAFIGPVCEEIIFRGIILEGFLQKYDSTKAILFSALIFGVIHFHPIQSVGAFFAGLVLGWIYLKTKSLWVCSSVHIINNLIAFSTMNIASTREYLSNDGLYLTSFGIAALASYAAFKYFNKVNNTDLIADNSTYSK